MTKTEWAKNDALMKAACKKLHFCFFRDQATWEAFAFSNVGREVRGYDINDNLVDCFVNCPESLGEVKYFGVYTASSDSMAFFSNIFYGVTCYEELAIKLDFM